MEYTQLQNSNILVQIYREGTFPALVDLPMDKCINVKRELAKQLKRMVIGILNPPKTFKKLCIMIRYTRKS